MDGQREDFLNLDLFAQNLLIQSGMSTNNFSVFQAEKQRLVRQLKNVLGEVILKNMPQEKLADLDRLSEIGNEERLFDFVLQNIPNLEQLLQYELDVYRSTYLPQNQVFPTQPTL